VAALGEHEFVRLTPGGAEVRRAAPPFGVRWRRRLAAYGELVWALTLMDVNSPSAATAARTAGGSPVPAASAAFAFALHGLAEAGRGGGLPALLRSSAAVRVLEQAWLGSGTAVAVGPADAGVALVQDVLVAADILERALRPLSLPWYEGRGGCAALAGADVCHVVGGPAGALPGLVAKHWLGLPLLLTAHSLHLRERYRGYRESRHCRPVRVPLLAFHQVLAGEVYAQAGVITPGIALDQRRQEYRGAKWERIRVIYEATLLADQPPVGAEPERPTLAWLGPMEPCGGLEPMLRAFALVREERPTAVLRVHGRSPAYEAHYRALGRRLFGASWVEAVSFDGKPLRLRSVFEHAGVLVFSGSEGVRPQLLAASQLSGRPVIATDVGAACEMLGPTGVLAPLGDPVALAAACTVLLRDAERRARLGTAGRQRAQELYAVESAVDAFRALYLELAAELPALAPGPVAQPFARPAEYWVGAFPMGVPTR
jgi:glycosyltransferase involved in cell wall biosynthesis